MVSSIRLAPFDNENKKLLFTPNRLDLFFNDNDWHWNETLNTSANPNIQVVSVPIDAQSYMVGQYTVEHKIKRVMYSFDDSGAIMTKEAYLNEVWKNKNVAEVKYYARRTFLTECEAFGRVLPEQQS